MRTTLLLGTAALALAMGGSAATASPLGASNGLNAAIETNDLVQDAAYIVGGYRYCFYFDGWQGPGWYRCGYAWRRGLGWGGGYGWQNWSYAPYERRHGGNRRMHRSNNDVHINRNATVNRNTNVNRNAVQQNRTVRGSNITRSNTRVNSNAKIGGSMHRSTTGMGAGHGSVHINSGGAKAVGGAKAGGGGKGEKH